MIYPTNFLLIKKFTHLEGIIANRQYLLFICNPIDCNFVDMKFNIIQQITCPILGNFKGGTQNLNFGDWKEVWKVGSHIVLKLFT